MGGVRHERLRGQAKRRGGARTDRDTALLTATDTAQQRRAHNRVGSVAQAEQLHCDRSANAPDLIRHNARQTQTKSPPNAAVSHSSPSEKGWGPIPRGELQRLFDGERCEVDVFFGDVTDAAAHQLIRLSAPITHTK